MSLASYSRRTLRLALPLALLLAAAPAVHAQDTLAAGGGFADRIMGQCRTDVRLINQVSGWATRWPGALEAVPVGSQPGREAALAYWADIPAALEADIASLREGLRTGTSAPRPVVRRVLAQVDGLLALPREESPFWSPARRSPDPAFRRAWSREAEAEWLPAIRRYRAFLGGDYFEAARATPGLGATPGGEACYQRLITAWTSLPATPADVEAAGRRTLAALQDELLALAAPEYGRTLAEVLDRLRNGRLPDPFESRDDVAQHARAAIRRAEAAIPEWIGSPGRVSIEVVPMPEYMESSFPAGFYRGPGEDGVAAYVINTSRPAERRLLSEAIAFHEAIPGHHTQNSARTGGGAFVAGLAEGWAIYAEVLADEMELYSSELDRIGRIAKHLWATSRLIIEPGLHTGGWSREDAIRFMLANTALPLDEIELEVDRYLALPGQSLSYMLGNLHLRALRESAETELGPLFDVREFHDVVLAPGMRPLTEVSADVGRWVARRTVSGGADTLRAFAPGALPTGQVYRGTFSPDGRAFYFFRGTGEENDYRIQVSRLVDGRWTAPRPVDLGGDHSDLYPSLSPDGGRLVFASYRAFPGATDGQPQANLWVADRQGDGWGTPRPLVGISLPDRYESHPMIETDGRLSFRRARADWSVEDALVAEPDGHGGWSTAAPDDRIERWRGWRDDVHLWGGLAHPSGDLVVLDISPLTPEGRRGRSDLWITRRTEEGWTEPVPAGSGINTEGWDNFPAFTPDGRQLVFVRDFDRFLTAPLELLPGSTG